MVTDRSVDGNSVSAPAANAWDSVFSEGVAVANDLTPEQLSTLGEESSVADPAQIPLEEEAGVKTDAEYMADALKEV